MKLFVIHFIVGYISIFVILRRYSVEATTVRPRSIVVFIFVNW